MSPQAAVVFAQFLKGGVVVRVGDVVYTRALRLPYSEMRQAIRQAGGEINEVLGTLLEVDHILEKRFFTSLENFPHPADFTSFLLPKNPDVARGLMENGVSGFLYVHSQKTAALARYLPYGYEHHFSAQEIYNAYQLVLVHELGMPYSLFEELTGQIFDSLVTIRGRGVNQRLIEANVLAGHVQRVVARLPLEP